MSGPLELLEGGDGVSAWEPERFLPTFSLQEIRFSRGFLRADYVRLFAALRALWVPIFTANDSQISVTGVEADFQFPGDLESLFIAKADGEAVLFALDGSSQEVIRKIFAGSTDRFGGGVLVDYLARRLLLTLSRSWTGTGAPTEILFLGDRDIGEVEIEGHLAVQCASAAGLLTIHIGLGPELLQRLDILARETLLQTVDLGGRSQKHSLVVEIGSLEPVALRGALEPGAWIRTMLPAEGNVLVHLPDGSALRGRLGQFNGRFAVESLGEVVDRNERAVALEIARGEVSEEDLALLGQPGAIFLTKTIVSSGASMMQQERLISKISLGKMGGRLVVAIEEG